MHYELELALKNAREENYILEERIKLYIIDYMTRIDPMYVTDFGKLIYNLISEKKFIRLLSDKHIKDEFIDSYKDMK